MGVNDDTKNVEALGHLLQNMREISPEQQKKIDINVIKNHGKW